MNIKTKLKLLGKAAQHDTCDPGCQLLKVLMSNSCKNNCKYCFCRKENNIQRASFQPQELASLFMQLVKKRLVHGLFLSSAVVKDTDYTMRQMLQCVYLIRNAGFRGYIHLKVLPGASEDLLAYARQIVERMSVNLELPSKFYLNKICPDKDFEQDLVKPMAFNKNLKLPAGQTTQLVVGSAGESDQDIITAMDWAYQKMDLKRVYYSAFQPITKQGKDTNYKSVPFKREFRLYQTDWLLRYYGFKKEEIILDQNKNLKLNIDPKTVWAQQNLLKPVEINKADYYQLLRIPGIGPATAKKIINSRKTRRITQDYELSKLKINLHKAADYILINNKLLPRQRQFNIPV